MDEPNDVVKILEEEYGIRSMADLDEAIAKLGFLDLSPFCAPINRKEKAS